MLIDNVVCDRLDTGLKSYRARQGCLESGTEPALRDCLLRGVNYSRRSMQLSPRMLVIRAASGDTESPSWPARFKRSSIAAIQRSATRDGFIVGRARGGLCHSRRRGTSQMR